MFVCEVMLTEAEFDLIHAFEIGIARNKLFQCFYSVAVIAGFFISA